MSKKSGSVKILSHQSSMLSSRLRLLLESIQSLTTCLHSQTTRSLRAKNICLTDGGEILLSQWLYPTDHVPLENEAEEMQAVSRLTSMRLSLAMRRISRMLPSPGLQARQLNPLSMPFTQNPELQEVYGWHSLTSLMHFSISLCTTILKSTATWRSTKTYGRTVPNHILAIRTRSTLSLILTQRQCREFSSRNVCMLGLEYRV